ncbi:MAG TPA: chemotaxis protein CheW [Candidatus Tetragenococcus pullicola]|nr:chemotaxis protein CheW [Candidatus Tetragenococcus pullicola]
MQMILFKMNQQHFLIEADSVEEVIDTLQITKVPLAPVWVEGLINLRGTVLTVINLAELLQIKRPQKSRNILILKQKEEKKGLLIEEVIEVIDVNPEEIQLADEKTQEFYAGLVFLSDQVANIIKVNHRIF